MRTTHDLLKGREIALTTGHSVLRDRLSTTWKSRQVIPAILWIAFNTCDICMWCSLLFRHKHWRIQGDHRPHAVCQWDLTPPTKNFVWTDGHWTTYSIYHANIHVGLVNLLLPDAFSQVHVVKKCVDGQRCAPDPAGELRALSQTPSWTEGKWVEEKVGKGKRRGGRGGKENKRERKGGEGEGEAARSGRWLQAVRAFRTWPGPIRGWARCAIGPGLWFWAGILCNCCWYSQNMTYDFDNILLRIAVRKVVWMFNN